MNVLSVRDFFAAHAPTEIPDWFEHVARFPVGGDFAQNARARFIQWRWEYADAMIAAREAA